MKLGKTLFGYNRSSVDRLIKDYEDRIQQVNDDNEYLREKLEESKFMFQAANAEYEKKIDELSHRKHSRISNVYAESYENIEELFKSAYDKSKRLVDSTVDNVNSVKGEYISVVEAVELKQQLLNDKFYSLVSLIGDIQLYMNDMREKTVDIKKTVKSVDVLSQQTLDEFEKITQSFDKQIGLEEHNVSKAKSKISFSEFLENYTGGGSIVDILRVYSGLND